MVSMAGYGNAYKLDTDAMDHGDSDGDGDDEQQAEATIDAAESGRGSYYDWGFHRDYCC